MLRSASKSTLSPRAWTLLTLASIALFLLSWSALHHFGLQKGQIKDTKVYVRYGHRIVDGQVPYRDFRVEYPPGALPTFVAPALISDRRPAYDRWFEREMAVCGCLVLIGTALCLARLGAGRLRAALALGVVGLSPLLMGTVILTRFDLWPTGLAVLGLAALLYERRVAAPILVGAAIVAKLWPAVLVPVACIWLYRRKGGREVLLFAAVTIAVLLVAFLPFAALSPGGLKYSFDRQFARPLQVESLGSSVLVLIHRFFGTTLGTTFGWGSSNVGGTGVGYVTTATSVLQVVGVLVVLVAFARASPTRANFVTAVAASVAMLVAFGKVFSPQFVIWLVPFVVLVPGRRGLAAGALLVAALVLTHVEFPRHYEDLAKYFYAFPAGIVLLRDLVVLAIAVLLVASLRPARGEPDSAMIPAWMRFRRLRAGERPAGTPTSQSRTMSAFESSTQGV